MRQEGDHRRNLSSGFENKERELVSLFDEQWFTDIENRHAGWSFAFKCSHMGMAVKHGDDIASVQRFG